MDLKKPPLRNHQLILLIAIWFFYKGRLKAQFKIDNNSVS